jgi:Asp-tRNA(Asn)/Glu-tRNA(Gln) amidotransferase C subunit
MDLVTVKRTAGIAHIDLTDDEAKTFEEELGGIFRLLDDMDDAPENNSLCFDAVGVRDILRDDVPVKYDNTEELLGGMNLYNGSVRGPKIA